MLFIQYGMPIVGLLVIALGLLKFNKKFVDMELKYTNNARGVKTHITPSTYTAHKSMGVLLIIMGIGLILFSLYLGDFLQSYL